jgi:hypothetical protein
MAYTSPASGVIWQIKIDYERHTVHSIRPTSNAKIDGGNYTLNRESGKLSVIFASSTTGHFLYDQCKLGN